MCWRTATRAAFDRGMDLLLDGYRVLRLFLAAVLACWAGLLALPGDSFARSTGYAWFAARGPEEAWAAGLGLAACACGSALVYRPPWWRMASALVTAVAFGVIAYGVWRANPLSPGTGTYICCAALSYALVLRNGASPTARDVAAPPRPAREDA